MLEINENNNEALYIYGKIAFKEKDYRKSEEMNKKAIDNQHQ